MPTYPAPTIKQAYTYVQDSEPAGPSLGETWLDTGSETPREAYAYDGATWVLLSATEHAELSAVSADDHHNPVTVTGPLTVDADQTLGLTATGGLGITGDGELVALLDEGVGLDGAGNIRVDVADGLTIDANGNVRVAGGSVTESMLAFDTANQSELDSHAGSAGGVHGVGAGDSVASQSDVDAIGNDLDSHSADVDAHHDRYTDSEAADAAILHSEGFAPGFAGGR